MRCGCKGGLGAMAAAPLVSGVPITNTAGGSRGQSQPWYLGTHSPLPRSGHTVMPHSQGPCPAKLSLMLMPGTDLSPAQGPSSKCQCRRKGRSHGGGWAPSH